MSNHGTSAAARGAVREALDVSHGDTITLSSMVYSDMLSVPVDILLARSPEAQRIREELLHGTRVVFVCAGFPTKKFIYELAHKKGVSIAIIDYPNSWSSTLLEEGIIDHFIPLDMSGDPDCVFVAALNSIEALAPAWLPDGVCTFVELAVELTSRLGKALGLPHSNTNSIETVRDKSRTRAALGDVKSVKISHADQILHAVDFVGIPGVMKPVSGAASLCVQRFNSVDEAVALYNQIRSEMVSWLVVSAGALGRRSTSVANLPPSSDDLPPASLHPVINPDIMVEEYLDGPEVDVDVIMSDGECQYATVIDNGPTFEPFFAETWAAVPSLMEPSSRVSELRNLAVDSLKRFGLTDGVFHVELKYTSRGPRLIEINARMGGGPTRKIHKLVAGVDLVIEQLLIAVGIPSRPPLPLSPLTRVAYAFINARTTGYVNSVNFFEKYKSRPHVVYIIPYIEPFEVCYGPQDNLPSWLGEIVVCHEDGEKALEIVQELESEIAQEFSQISIPVCLS